MNKKLISKLENEKFEILKNEDVLQIKKI